MTFIIAYIKTMRLYYSFITGIAGWIGVSFYFWAKTREGLEITGDDYVYGAIALVILFLSWGVNQIFNDWLGLPEDRINAPNRPMVTGELNVTWALTLSSVLMGIAAVISWFLNPWSLVPLTLGFLMNFLYNYSKAWGLWANVVFGVMISNCSLYGFLAAGPMLSGPLFDRSRVAGLFLVALMNGLMTYFTYFKDYEGDKAAGKDTFIVRHGIEKARVVGLVGAFLPTICFFAARALGAFSFRYTEYFIYCGVMTIFLQFWTAIRFYRNPVGPKAYFSNATNFRACVAGQVTLIAMFNGHLALYLFSFSYIFIGFLFGLHEDSLG
ncbi:MAG TPA: UbiA family prenyltransferase [Candidatus Ozemobacteraceae bacterium]|nr:UbiA family prenyltransferase [Candidatus Ozemobacteraceae bacterium]